MEQPTRGDVEFSYILPYIINQDRPPQRILGYTRILNQDIHKGDKPEGGYDTAKYTPEWFTLDCHLHCIHHLRQQLLE